jgi:hypothetical protein
VPAAQPRKKPNVVLRGCLVVIAIVVGLGILAAIVGGNSHPTNQSASNTSSERDQSTANESTSAVTHSNGFTVLGGLGYRIDSLSHPTSISSFGVDKTPAGEFIVLHISVANVGRKGADISSSDFHLKSGDAQFDPDNGITVEGEFFLEKLNPGTTKSGVLVFDVPASTSPHKYALEVFGNGAEGSQVSTLIPL